MYSVSLLGVLDFSVNPFGVVGIGFCTGHDLPSILLVHWGFPWLHSFCA